MSSGGYRYVNVQTNLRTSTRVGSSPSIKASAWMKRDDFNSVRASSRAPLPVKSSRHLCTETLYPCCSPDEVNDAMFLNVRPGLLRVRQAGELRSLGGCRSERFIFGSGNSERRFQSRSFSYRGRRSCERRGRFRRREVLLCSFPSFAKSRV